MAKFYDVIAYNMGSQETALGIWTPTIFEKKYKGNVISKYQKWEETENFNDNLTINGKISIVADQFAYENLSTIAYIRWHGVNWKVINISIDRPRLILTLGGVFNVDPKTVITRTFDSIKPS